MLYKSKKLNIAFDKVFDVLKKLNIAFDKVFDVLDTFPHTRGKVFFFGGFCDTYLKIRDFKSFLVGLISYGHIFNFTPLKYPLVTILDFM